MLRNLFLFHWAVTLSGSGLSPDTALRPCDVHTWLSHRCLGLQGRRVSTLLLAQACAGGGCCLPLAEVESDHNGGGVAEGWRWQDGGARLRGGFPLGRHSGGNDPFSPPTLSSPLLGGLGRSSWSLEEGRGQFLATLSEACPLCACISSSGPGTHLRMQVKHFFLPSPRAWEGLGER
jgi:hypothetical protein